MMIPGRSATTTKRTLLRMSQAAYQRNRTRIPFDRASLKCIVRYRSKGEREGDGEGEGERVMERERE